MMPILRRAPSLALTLLAGILAVAILFAGAVLPVTADAGQLRQTPTPLGTECGRMLPAMAALLRRDYGFDSATITGANYCERLEGELATFIEALLDDPAQDGIPGESRGAFAFIDFGARQFVGEVPQGAALKAVARNELPDSTMVYVVGPDFAVFVDYTFTTISASDFDSLPDYRDYSGGIRPNCEASWCRPPGPRPTQSR